MARGMSVAAIAATASARREQEAREEAVRMRKLYGDALEAVQLLRRRGYAVNRQGDRILVGNKLLTREEVKAMARREGGLAGMSFTRPKATASGLKVGDAVALVAKKKARPATPKVERKLSGAAAVARARASEHSTDLGTRPRVVWLDLGLLDVDRRYQRELSKEGSGHINRILKAFNWNCYQPIIVTETEGGRFAVIDGQHRLEAAKKHPLIDSLPCYIIGAADVAMQARIFVEVNSNRRALTSSQKFWASHAAGDAGAVALAAICKDAGVTILRGPPGGAVPPKALLGPLALLRFIAANGPAAVREAIVLLAETHGTTPGAFRASTIGALTRLAAAADYSRDRTRRVLAAADLSDLYGKAMALTKGGNAKSITLAVERLLRGEERGAS
jgi:hypothetical protein